MASDERAPLLGDDPHNEAHRSKASLQAPDSRTTSPSINESSVQVLPPKVTAGLIGIGNGAAIMHIIKGNIGTGILAMADAFKNSGLVVGTVGILLMGFIATHCMHLLVYCNSVLCEKLEKNSLDYGEVMEECVRIGPRPLRRFSAWGKRIVNVFLCITQFGFCIVYVLFVADNIRQIVAATVHWCPGVRLFEFFVLLTLVPYSFVRNLKLLAPFSMIANLLTVVGLVIVFQYCLQHLKAIDSLPAPIFKSWGTLPLYFGTAIYAFEGISLVLPVKIKMRQQEAFGGLTGVLNTAMVIVTVGYTAVGFYGYLRFGDQSLGSITLNLPLLPVNWLYLSVRVIFAVTIFISYGVQFYVPIEILYPPIRRKIPSEFWKKYGEFVFRTLMVIFTFLIAVVIPHLNLMISLIGALSSSSLALIFPPIMEMLLRWTDKDYGRYNWRLCKDVLILLFGFVGFVTGTVVSILEIVKAFQQPRQHSRELDIACNNTQWKEYINGSLPLYY